MPRLLSAKLVIAICILASLVIACGGSNTEDATPTPVPEAQEEQSASSEPEVETEPEAVDGDREAPVSYTHLTLPTIE